MTLDGPGLRVFGPPIRADIPVASAPGPKPVRGRLFKRGSAIRAGDVIRIEAHRRPMPVHWVEVGDEYVEVGIEDRWGEAGLWTAVSVVAVVECGFTNRRRKRLRAKARRRERLGGRA